MTKRIIAAALALTTVFTAGCGKNGSEKVKDTSKELSKGRYMEDVVETEDIIQCYEFTNGDTPQMPELSYNGETNLIHTYKEGRFTSSALNGSAVIGDHNLPSDSALSPNGDIFFGCMAPDSTDEELLMRYGILTPEGETKEVKTDDILLSFEYADNGDLYACNAVALYRLDRDSLTFVKLCDLDNIYSRLDIVGDLIYLSDPDYGTDGIIVYDTAAGDLCGPDEALADFWRKNYSDKWNGSYDIFGDKDGAVYIVCPKGIYRHVSGGSVVEQLVDGMMTSLGGDGDKICYGTADSDGGFLISFQNADIKRYYYDPDAVTEFTSELNIYSLHESAALTQAVRAYTRRHPEVKVNCEYGMHDGVTYEDAMKELTTKILSDNAPDIIIPDGMDINALENKGMLEDLSNIRDKWQPDNKLMTNLTEWNNDGGLYSVAARFGAVAHAGEKDSFGSLTSLGAVFEHTLKADSEGKLAHPDIPMDDEQISARVKKDLILISDTLLKDGKPNKQALEDYYTSAQKVYSGGQLLFCEESMWDVAYLGVGITSDTVGTFYNSQDIKALCSVNDGRDNIKHDYGIGGNGLCFEPVFNLAICTSGNHKENAAAFIYTALSSEVQSMASEEGLPVDSEELEKLIENDEMTGSLGLTVSDGSYFEYRLNDPEPDELSALLSYAETADTPLMADEQTLEILTEAAMSCINNSLSPSEAAEQAMSKLELKTKE